MLALTHTMTNSPIERPQEIQPETAHELMRLGLGALIDVRQTFELEVEGEVEGAENIPLFNFMQGLGHRLSAEEQELLDADEPSAKDIISFLAAINRHHYQSDNVILCLCNSGRRSLHAVQLLRSINYDRCFSIAGGVRAWREKFPRAEQE